MTDSGQTTPALPQWYAEKPVATVDDLGSKGVWIEYPLSEAEIVNRRANLTPDRRPILTPLGAEIGQ